MEEVVLSFNGGTAFLILAVFLFASYCLGYYLGATRDDIHSSDLKEQEKPVTIKGNKVEFAKPVTTKEAFETSKTLDEFIHKNNI